MRLDEFVAETLKQIVKGVRASQEEIEGMGGAVSPPVNPIKGDGVTHVDFDAAIVVSSTDATGGKLQVAFLGGERSAQSSEQATSRVRFRVDINLPPGNSDAWLRAVRAANARRHVVEGER